MKTISLNSNQIGTLIYSVEEERFKIIQLIEYWKKQPTDEQSEFWIDYLSKDLDETSNLLKILRG